ncbi:MAG: hypothetical protein OXF73_02970 [Gammaproteobacteria bacterium]|nr:hypothetical protein [Gammaproteobacteria bacterium]MCY4226312.1 hypothetical protein [Gammaproteobacteria bacterium]
MNKLPNWYIQRKIIQEMQALPDRILVEIGVDRDHIPDHVKMHCAPQRNPMSQKLRVDPFQANSLNLGEAA